MRVPRSLVLIFVFALAAQIHAAAPGVYAIVGGTVHRASGPPIENGTVVIRAGLIEAVGPDLAVPADATVIDAKGHHVYPGLFDAQTSLGMPAPPRRRSPQPGQAQQRPEEPRGPTPSPSFVAAQHLSFEEDAFDSRRARGITTVLVASTSDIFNGQSAILNLAGENTGSMLIKTPASMQISFAPRSGFTNFPGSLMGVLYHIRQTLLDAQHNEAASAIYARNPAGKERPIPSPDLEALRTVLRRDLPVVFIAHDELMIRRAAELAREFNLRWIVSGARQSYRAADFLRQTGVPVLLSMDFPKPPTERREDQPLREIRDRLLGPTGPAELEKRGVRFALVSGATTSPADFIRGIRKTIEKGLGEEAALRAVTLAPAQIFGVDRQIGSLERGKIANVFVSDKKFFESEAKLTNLWIDGRLISLPEEPEDDEAAESPAAGTWDLIIRAPEGEIAMQVILRVDGGRLAGSYSGDRGSGEIRGGTVEGSSVEFTITARAVPGGETSDWHFEGTVTDGSMQGTVSTTIGTFQFTGSKAQ